MDHMPVAMRFGVRLMENYWMPTWTMDGLLTFKAPRG